ncbi:hypothetical protein ACWCYL_18505 [Streptomyces sp. 900105755]
MAGKTPGALPAAVQGARTAATAPVPRRTAVVVPPGSCVTTRVGALDAVRQAAVVAVLHRQQAVTRLHDGRLVPA